MDIYDWKGVLDLVWQFMNSKLGITIIVGIAGWLLAKLYIAKPEWKKYEGYIIAGIKFAEKSIPDDSPQSSIRKLDIALKYVLKAYEAINNKRASAKVVTQLENAIQVVHEKMEADGVMDLVNKIVTTKKK